MRNIYTSVVLILIILTILIHQHYNNEGKVMLCCVGCMQPRFYIITDSINGISSKSKSKPNGLSLMGIIAKNTGNTPNHDAHL